MNRINTDETPEQKNQSFTPAPRRKTPATFVYGFVHVPDVCPMTPSVGDAQTGPRELGRFKSTLSPMEPKLGNSERNRGHGILGFSSTTRMNREITKNERECVRPRP